MVPQTLRVTLLTLLVLLYLSPGCDGARRSRKEKNLRVHSSGHIAARRLAASTDTTTDTTTDAPTWTAHGKCAEALIRTIRRASTSNETAFWLLVNGTACNGGTADVSSYNATGYAFPGLLPDQISEELEGSRFAVRVFVAERRRCCCCWH